jgi:hypothetical protein
MDETNLEALRRTRDIAAERMRRELDKEQDLAYDQMRREAWLAQRDVFKEALAQFERANDAYLEALRRWKGLA